MAADILLHLRTLTAAEQGDRELLLAFARNCDEAAFAALVRRHGAMVHGVCGRLLGHEQDTEDAFQATFLVLARKATSLRTEAVGAWLHGVAWNVAQRLRRSMGRQRRLSHGCDSRRTRPTAEGPVAEASLRELQALLDDEVARLPERLRAPFVACCLEGQSKTEAARALGWKEGTVSSRLAQARERIRQRLLRRGVSLSAVLTAVALEQRATASAAAPGAGTASPVAIRLADSLLNTSLAFKAGLAALVLLAGVVTACATIGYWQSASGVRPEEGLKQPSHEPRAEGRKPKLDLYGDPLPTGAVARLGTTRLRQTEPVTVLAFSPDGTVLASGGRDDGIVYIWDAASGKQLRRFLGHKKPPSSPNARTISSIAFSLDGKTAASIGGDGGVRIWEVETGKEIRRIGEQASTQSLALSPDGKLLASGGWDQLIYLWEVSSGKEIGKLSGHRVVVRAVSFAADGKTLASGGDDGIIRLWDVAGKKEVGQLTGHLGLVLHLQFLPDGKTLLG